MGRGENMFQKSKVASFVLFMCFIFFPQEKGYAAGCQHAYARCSLQELLKLWFPDTTGDPSHSLKKKDGHGRLYEFPQLARFVDNDVSDFSWDKVLYPGELDLTPGGENPRVLKPGWFYNGEDVGKWKEDARFTKVDPENGHWRATSAHWPYEPGNSPHVKNASFWIIVKTKEGAIPGSWYADPGRDKGKRYLARPIHSWRRRPPNCPATGGR